MAPVRAPLIVAAMLALAAPALAAAPAEAPRSPEQRQQLADLAHALGEAHAFRLLCGGPTDQTWRAQMNAMLAVEAPDAGFRRRLVAGFNAGFAARQTEFPSCTEAARTAEREAASKGAALARRLAGRGG